MSPSCDATGMSCACARGLIVIAIVQRDRHVIRSRMRPYCRRHRATQPACRALAHEALSSSPSCDATGMSYARVQGLIVLARLATRPACRALAHEALLLSPSCNATGMLYARVRGLIVVAIVRRDWHVVRSRMRPHRCCPSGDATGMSCACARGLIVVARLAT